MEIKFNAFVTLVGTGIILINFILAFFVIKKYSFSITFFLCIANALLLSINTILGKYIKYTNTYNLDIIIPIQNFIFLLDLFFWTLFFSKILKDKKNKVIIKFLFFLALFLSSYAIYLNQETKLTLHVLAIINIYKAILCVLYYQKLSKIVSRQNIFSDPVFWIVTGVLFYSSLSIPIYGLVNYIKGQISSTLYLKVFTISNLMIIIMHLFFIKANLCAIRAHKV